MSLKRVSAQQKTPDADDYLYIKFLEKAKCGDRKPIHGGLGLGMGEVTSFEPKGAFGVGAES